MTIQTWVGITVAGDSLILVELEICPSDDIKVISDVTWKLQAGSRPQAYSVMYERVSIYLKERNITHIAIKASAVSKNSTIAHLRSAELRGVVSAAAASSGANVKMVRKADVSKTFGDRKVDEYVSDDSFWNSRLPDGLRKMSRETALLIISLTKP